MPLRRGRPGRGGAAGGAVRARFRLLPALVAALLLAGGVVGDLFGSQPYMGLPLLSAAPLVASALLSFRASLLFAVSACAASVLLDLHLGRPRTALLVDLADVLTTSCLALGINRILALQGRRLAQVRDVAEIAQRAVLPDPPRRAGPVTVAARYVAAQTEARIGGDLYAVQSTPFGVRAIIGDVKGKGLGAVSTVSVLIGAFRVEADHVPTLGELAARLDDVLARGAGEASEDFTTAVLLQIPPDGRTAHVCNRGHPPPYLVDERTVSPLEPSTHEVPLGLRLWGAGPDGGAPTDVFPLRPGASLLLITDGVTEARDERGTFYDPVDRLAPGPYANPRRLVDALVRDVARWTGGGNQDDMAVLALTRTAGRSGGPGDTAPPAP
ncbi:PP2C family protein-serine/threonine phosphatase [Streptomyces sp. SID10815]|uniref:PP2C family protein-serine/threonine phosphatase n=1 Tax=Streptomyces sp. SID10815 TaxID=2706027 RepID=UPI0013C64B25|nr:PP2C family protein-serine/threonine phosphatase [Streptomyces sp. SID10815]NEA52305.1 serine/threonine-protein phosphatase [Streptomyces sp. SID10815]